MGHDAVKPLDPSIAGLGTSMLPFFRSGTEIRVEPVREESIRPGDLLTALSGSGALFTHRVVRVLQVGDQRAFLTKGDNRLQFDPLVFPDEVAGRVVWAGSRDLRRRGWRWLGRGIAFLSYAQAMAYQRLFWSRSNRLRHRLAKRGWFPRVRLSSSFRSVTNPVGWASGSPLVESARIRLSRISAWSRRIHVRPQGAEDLGCLVHAWNAAFPGRRTTAERLQARLLRDGPAAGERFLTAWQGGDLLGWGYARLSGRDRGSIEFIAPAEAGRRRRADRLLFLELLSWLRRQGARDVSFGPLPFTDLPGGAVPSDPVLRIALRSGFHWLPPLVEMRLDRASFRGESPDGNGLRFRPWQPEDDRRLRTSFRVEGYDPGLVRRHLNDGGEPEQILVVCVRERPVGLCHWLPDLKLADVRQVNWVWSVSERSEGAGYLFQFAVEEAWRGQGVGKALAVQAAEALFRSGCSAVICWTPIPAFFERMGFIPGQPFARMRKEGGIR